MGDQIQSAVEKAMAGERPMDSNKPEPSPAPARTALEIAMETDASQRPQRENSSKAREEIPPSQNPVLPTDLMDVHLTPGGIIEAKIPLPESTISSTEDLIKQRDALDREIQKRQQAANQEYAIPPHRVDATVSPYIKKDPAEEKIYAAGYDYQKTSEKTTLPLGETVPIDKSPAALETDKPNGTTQLNTSTEIKPSASPQAEIQIPSTEAERNKDVKERNFKTAALIAGVVVGGATGILAGTSVGIPVAATAGVVALGGKITDYFLGRSITKIEKQRDDLSLDNATREKLQKREQNLRKIQNIIQHVTKFATGVALGAGISNFISTHFMGGHGLIWNPAEPSPLTPPPSPETPPTPPPSPETPPTPEVPYEGNSLIHDGRVDLPGSAWDGNMANGPAQDTLLGGAENYSNFAGGQSEMAAYQLGQDLEAQNITDQLLGQLSTPEKHRLLTSYWDAIRGGNPNPDLITTLKGMGTEGAKKLLTALGY